jgi:hypothetical protein
MKESSMPNPMLQTRLVSAVVATMIGSSLAIALPASATDADTSGGSTATIRLAQSCGSYGSYATIRRANEVAYTARGLGYSTLVFHNGDGYYVRVC